MLLRLPGLHADPSTWTLTAAHCYVRYRIRRGFEILAQSASLCPWPPSAGRSACSTASTGSTPQRRRSARSETSGWNRACARSTSATTFCNCANCSPPESCQQGNRHGWCNRSSIPSAGSPNPRASSLSFVINWHRPCPSAFHRCRKNPEKLGGPFFADLGHVAGDWMDF